jgi:hypothetical protein
MGKDHHVNLGRIYREYIPISKPVFFHPLKKAAVHKDFEMVDFE